MNSVVLDHGHMSVTDFSKFIQVQVFDFGSVVCINCNKTLNDLMDNVMAAREFWWKLIRLLFKQKEKS